MKKPTALSTPTRQMRLRLSSDLPVIFDEPLRREIVQILAQLLATASEANKVVAMVPDEAR
jgi:hypothetical protein